MEELVDPIRDIQVLCPMNRSVTGARNLNQMLQSVLTPPGEHSIEKYGSIYDRDVYNGDFGYVVGMDRDRW